MPKGIHNILIVTVRLVFPKWALVILSTFHTEEGRLSNMSCSRACRRVSFFWSITVFQSPQQIIWLESGYKIVFFQALEALTSSTSPAEIIKDIVSNKITYQGPLATICSHLTVYWLLFRARGFSPSQIQKNKLTPNKKVILDVIPEIIESLLPREIQIARKDKVRFNWKAIQWV